jgi:ADP-heptose:LPS heptosyltransferase
MNIVIKLPSDLKHAMLVLPALKKIKLHYETIHITLLARSPIKAYMDYFDYYDEIINLNEKIKLTTLFFLLKRTLKGRKYDYYLSFSGADRVGLVLKFLGIRKRNGPIVKLFDGFIFNLGLKQYRHFADEHEVSYNINLVNRLGLNLTDQQSLSIKASSISAENKRSHWTLLVSPEGANPRWSSRNFARIITRAIDNNLAKNFCVIYSREDQQFMQSFFHEKNKKSVIWDQGEIKLYCLEELKSDALVDLLMASKVVVGHNNGLLHLACYFDLPVVGLNLPLLSYSLRRYAPYASVSNSKLEMMVPKVVCGEIDKCSEQSCPYYECMAKIEVKTVLELARKLESS